MSVSLDALIESSANPLATKSDRLGEQQCRDASTMRYASKPAQDRWMKASKPEQPIYLHRQLHRGSGFLGRYLSPNDKYFQKANANPVLNP
jgi:hypothetical protein